MKYIAGEEVGKRLLAMPKLDANIEIGLMQKNDPTLAPKLNSMVLKWMNDFVEINNIKSSNFVETTRDSILIIGKIPTKLIFENGDVEFKNKEGEYTSLYRLSGKLILFDSMRNEIRIKGVSEKYVNESPFVTKFFKPLLATMESSSSVGMIKCMKSLQQYREKYIDAEDSSIFRELNSQNKFAHIIDGEVSHADMILDEQALIKSGNFNEYVLPIMRSILQ
jgi:hypothetical protein